MLGPGPAVVGPRRGLPDRPAPSSEAFAAAYEPLTGSADSDTTARSHSRPTYRGVMRRSWRWAVSACVVAVLVALPFVVRYAPVLVQGTGPDAPAVLARMQASWSRPYAGYAESTGSLALPSTDQLFDVSTLLSSRTQVRVWWRSAADWRSDVISAAGETGTRTFAAAVSTWDYEDNRVVVSPPEVPGSVRLPTATDTLPPQLAARMLGAATAAEVTSVPARRVAGRPAVGVRFQPADRLTSIGHVDAWADEASGIPVLVEVFARTGETAAMSSAFLDFTDAIPTDADLAFAPPQGARVQAGQRYDLVRDVVRSAAARPPVTLLGFERATPARGLETIGEYGRGVTQIAVSALPERLAEPLRDQLVLAASATRVPQGVAVTVGPVGLLLSDAGAGGQSWLVAGTLTQEGLVQAAAALGSVTAS